MKELWDTDYLGDTRAPDVHICWRALSSELSFKGMIRHQRSTLSSPTRLVMCCSSRYSIRARAYLRLA